MFLLTAVPVWLICTRPITTATHTGYTVTKKRLLFGIAARTQPLRPQRLPYPVAPLDSVPLRPVQIPLGRNYHTRCRTSLSTKPDTPRGHRLTAGGGQLLPRPVHTSTHHLGRRHRLTTVGRTP